jgi:tRNA (uracil-5-)-methyltransferase TRM9
VAHSGWGDALRAATGSEVAPFDVAVALAVLHHIPGIALRASVLHEMVSLVRPGGWLVVSVWQFVEHARMQRKLVDWSEIGMAPERLERGDYLLDWKRGGRGLRYCHMVDEAELQELAPLSGLRVRSTFRAGGQEGNLSLFAVLDPE